MALRIKPAVPARAAAAAFVVYVLKAVQENWGETKTELRELAGEIVDDIDHDHLLDNFFIATLAVSFQSVGNLLEETPVTTVRESVLNLLDEDARNRFLEYDASWHQTLNGDEGLRPWDAVAGRFCEGMGFTKSSQNITEFGSERYLSPLLVGGVGALLCSQAMYWKAYLDQFEIEGEEDTYDEDAGIDSDDEEEEESPAQPDDDFDQSPLSDDEKAEALSLIGKLVDKGVSKATKRELEEFKQDIANGVFDQVDLRYLRARYKQLTK